MSNRSGNGLTVIHLKLLNRIQLHEGEVRYSAREAGRSLGYFARQGGHGDLVQRQLRAVGCKEGFLMLLENFDARAA
ncbi:hypothetical protein D3C81_2215300 [compost metagenome]